MGPLSPTFKGNVGKICPALRFSGHASSSSSTFTSPSSPPASRSELLSASSESRPRELFSLTSCARARHRLKPEKFTSRVRSILFTYSPRLRRDPGPRFSSSARLTSSFRSVFSSFDISNSAIPVQHLFQLSALRSPATEPSALQLKMLQLN